MSSPHGQHIRENGHGCTSTTREFELPDGVIGPIFNDEYGDARFWTKREHSTSTIARLHHCLVSNSGQNATVLGYPAYTEENSSNAFVARYRPRRLDIGLTRVARVEQQGKRIARLDHFDEPRN